MSLDPTSDAERADLRILCLVLMVFCVAAFIWKACDGHSGRLPGDRSEPISGERQISQRDRFTLPDRWHNTG